jgi:hypothetical protein
MEFNGKLVLRECSKLFSGLSLQINHAPRNCDPIKLSIGSPNVCFNFILGEYLKRSTGGNQHTLAMDVVKLDLRSVELWWESIFNEASVR